MTTNSILQSINPNRGKQLATSNQKLEASSLKLASINHYNNDNKQGAWGKEHGTRNPQLVTIRYKCSVPVFSLQKPVAGSLQPEAFDNLTISTIYDFQNDYNTLTMLI